MLVLACHLLITSSPAVGRPQTSSGVGKAALPLIPRGASPAFLGQKRVDFLSFMSEDE